MITVRVLIMSRFFVSFSDGQSTKYFNYAIPKLKPIVLVLREAGLEGVYERVGLFPDSPDRRRSWDDAKRQQITIV
jgi:hypothetical protein